ncbi:MAG: lipid-A-disaccharide synthase [Chthoniobacterales bacterium]
MSDPNTTNDELPSPNCKHLDRCLSIAIVAGEASGDTHGAALMQSLSAQNPAIVFSGAGGPKMEAHAHASGGTIDNWIAEAAVLGLWEVLKKYGYFRTKFSALLKQLTETTPDAIILVDYPGFNLRLAKAIRRRKLPIKIFYYISPQVWAWNRRRIPEMARALDLMICIFPFEEKFYQASGLPTSFAGHPLVERLTNERKISVIQRDEKLLGLFPGSREREVRKIFPAMMEAAQRVMQSRPDVRCEVAAATAAHGEMMKSTIAEANISMTVTIGHAHELMQRAAFGLICSGTATLEAACFGLPYALVYKVAWLTYAVGRQLIRVPHLGIINILAEQPVIREFIQNNATPDALATEALHFLNNKEAREKLSSKLENVVATLHGEGAYDRAAAAILQEIGYGR